MHKFIQKLDKLIPNVRNRAFVLAPDIVNRINLDDYTANWQYMVANNLKFVDYHSQKFRWRLYDGFPQNQHHLTTSFIWDVMRKDVASMLGIDMSDEDQFVKYSNIHGAYDLSIHQKPCNDKFKITNYSNKTVMIGDHVNAVRGLFDKDSEHRYSPYHKLFIGSHQCCKIENLNPKSGRSLMIACDSMAIPLVPILAFYYDSILHFDTRYEGVDYVSVAKNFNATDFLSVYLTWKYFDDPLDKVKI